ncbi:hypothetical protein Acr_02g0008150 [Actinidia rufa]|uniref:Uncharacterized protein n=1 Tax=Actinidia rufa TaxID=165716 RepID=A0A7J0E875_9ERIC|nr:hypothetical protein Acr_02g0008150 [Actinidia rufa]
MTVLVVPSKVRNGELTALDHGDEDDDEMLSPYEIVARGSAILLKTTFSMLEGVGRVFFIALCETNPNSLQKRFGVQIRCGDPPIPVRGGDKIPSGIGAGIKKISEIGNEDTNLRPRPAPLPSLVYIR